MTNQQRLELPIDACRNSGLERSSWTRDRAHTATRRDHSRSRHPAGPYQTSPRLFRIGQALGPTFVMISP